jgi:osmotically-inducible protein OsmY
MADYDRYSNQNRDFDRERRYGRDRDESRGWDRDRGRFDDRRLDDRTGYGAQESRGYQADRFYQGATDYGRDDQYSSNYGGYEDRSFSSDRSSGGSGSYGGGSGGSYGAGQRYPDQGRNDPYGYDQSSYGSGGASREYQTNRPQGGGMRQNHSSEGFGGSRYTSSRQSARESYAFNPYEQGGITSEFGFGQWDRDDNRYLRDRERNQYRGRGDDDRGFFEKMGDRVASWFGDDDRRGEHSGRGPKGYKRSDERIREDVSDRLADDSWLDASDIEVIVADMEVTLVGTVRDRDSKRRAEELAERISGVKHVQNNLRVSQLNRSTDDYGSSMSGGSSDTTGSSTTSGDTTGSTTAGQNATLNKQAAGRA